MAHEYYETKELAHPTGERQMTDITDIEFAKYLLETLAPDLRESGQTATASDVEDAGHRLLHAAEIVHTMFDGETQ